MNRWFKFKSILLDLSNYRAIVFPKVIEYVNQYDQSLNAEDLFRYIFSLCFENIYMTTVDNLYHCDKMDNGYYHIKNNWPQLEKMFSNYILSILVFKMVPLNCCITFNLDTVIITNKGIQ